MTCQAHVQTGQSEVITSLVLDGLGEPLLGSTSLRLTVRRQSDGEYLDWSDNTFKPVADVVLLTAALAEVDPIGSPGLYHLNQGVHVGGVFHIELTTNAVSPDSYTLTLRQAEPVVASNLPQVAELAVGGWLDRVDTMISSRVSPAGVAQALQDLRLHELALAVATGAAQSGSFIDQLLDVVQAIQSQQVFSVLQSYAYDPATDTLSGSIWVEHENLVVADAASASVRWFNAKTEALLFSLSDVLPDARGVFYVESLGPGLQLGTAYYAVAEVTLATAAVVQGVKGSFTF